MPIPFTYSNSVSVSASVSALVADSVSGSRASAFPVAYTHIISFPFLVRRVRSFFVLPVPRIFRRRANVRQQGRGRASARAVRQRTDAACSLRKTAGGKSGAGGTFAGNQSGKIPHISPEKFPFTYISTHIPRKISTGSKVLAGAREVPAQPRTWRAGRMRPRLSDNQRSLAS